MIRRRKNVDWEKVLPPEDLAFVWQQVQPDVWYPMATFERLGVAILDHLDGATLDAVHLWGRYSAQQFDAPESQVVVKGDPVESLMRLRVMRNTLFNFPAFDIPMLTPGHAHVTMTYHMGPKAEEAACYQTMGFCEGVVSMTGATRVRAVFQRWGWRGDEKTMFSMQWDDPE
jgi:hypothetical protein